ASQPPPPVGRPPRCRRLPPPVKRFSAAPLFIRWPPDEPDIVVPPVTHGNPAPENQRARRGRRPPHQVQSPRGEALPVRGMPGQWLRERSLLAEGRLQVC